MIQTYTELQPSSQSLQALKQMLTTARKGHIRRAHTAATRQETAAQLTQHLRFCNTTATNTKLSMHIVALQLRVAVNGTACTIALSGKLSFSIQLSGQEGWAQARPDMNLQGQGKAPEQGTLQPGGKT